MTTYAYAHHIERLMVVGSLMLLLEVHPHAAHRWFMEMYIDSSDWVMGPNVYGMALFSDGGIFATKPYICGSNYYRKMGGYRPGEWCEGVDGLYWQFIEKHEDFFSKNPRLSMMARTVKKMDPKRKKQIFSEAEKTSVSVNYPGLALVGFGFEPFDYRAAGEGDVEGNNEFFAGGNIHHVLVKPSRFQIPKGRQMGLSSAKIRDEFSEAVTRERV